MNAELNGPAKGRIDFFAYDWYPIYSQIVSNPRPESGIMRPYLAHVASPYGQNVKRVLVLQKDWVAWPDAATAATWSNLSVYTAWYQGQFNVPGYLRIDGKPVIGLFDPIGWKANANTLVNLNLMLSQLEPVYIIGYGTVTGTVVGPCRLNALGSYDGALGAELPADSAQHPWSDQLVADTHAAIVAAGFDNIRTVTILNDRRADSNGAGSYADAPSIPDQLAALQAAIAARPRILMLSPWTEITEAGPLLPTIQDGSRYIDVVGWARGETRPASYEYPQDFRTFYFAKAGTWTRNTTVTGAYDSDDMQSSGAGDTIIETAANANAHLGTTRVKIYATRHSAGGSISVELNGATVATVSCAGTTQVMTLVYDSGTLAPGIYRVGLTVVSGSPRPDCIRRTFAP